MAHGNNRVDIDGYTFLSPSEGRFYLKVKRAKENGVILDFEIAPKYELQPKFTDWRGKKIDSIDHYPDFFITRLDGSQYIIDTKGGSFHEKDAVLKRKMWLYKNQGIPYYYASEIPKFLGKVWCETSTGNNFEKKLKDLYYKILHPDIKRATATSPQIRKSEIDEYFDWECLDGLFNRMIKKYTKKEREKMAKEKEK
jgi:hypothetical protein